jgi:hypothetical protein
VGELRRRHFHRESQDHLRPKSASSTPSAKSHRPQFFGSVIGDHVKPSIGTRLMPGTYIGFCAALLGSSIPAALRPSFSFWSDKGLAPYDMEKAKQS